MIKLTNGFVKIDIPNKDLKTYLNIGWKIVKNKTKKNNNPKDDNGNQEIKNGSEQAEHK